MNESIKLLSQVMPQLAIIALLCGFIGWSLRGSGRKPTKNAPKSGAGEKGSDRIRTLEAALEKSKASHKALKAEFEEHQSSSVSRKELDAATVSLETARVAAETDAKKTSILEADLKKSQETIRNLNTRSNEGNKAQKDRSFALENELSKVRQELAILQERPDDTTGLHAEIERLRESVAVSTRFAGELRKRETAALEALEKAKAQLAELGDPDRTTLPVSKNIGPFVDSGRIAAAKAEVLRILELNKQRSIEPSQEDVSPEAAANEAPTPVQPEPEEPVLDPVTEEALSSNS
jgi:hypothetical protein